MDAGPVADCEARPRSIALDTAAEVEAKLAAACVPLVRPRACRGSPTGAWHSRSRSGARATYCRRLSKEDGALDFQRAGAAALAARINGLFPWPACSVELAGVAVKIGLADAPAARAPPPAAPGTVLGADRRGLLVAARHGRPAPAAPAAPGRPHAARGRVPPGISRAARATRIASRPMPELVGPAPFR